MIRYKLILLIAFLATVGLKAQGPYKPTWESIATAPVPEWFEDAKFGIFIHWGVYSVIGYTPEGYAEWYPHFMYKQYPPGTQGGYGQSVRSYHIKTYGDGVGYASFVDQFKAENWDPERWAELFRQSGARYIVPVAEHHDGFAMWDSDLTSWDAKDRGPQRDIIGELGRSVRKRGLKYAPSYHRERHFWYFDSVMVAREIEADPELAGLYGPFSLTREFIEDYTARWKELEEKYKPDFMWLDHVPYFEFEKTQYAHMIPAFKEAFKPLIADYLNRGPEWGKAIYFNNKGQEIFGINFPVGIREGDNLIMDDRNVKWQNPATIAHSYGYNRLDEENHRYKSADILIDLLVDIVSKNGNLLLNVGPKADGTISEAQQERLLRIGQWLEINGEAIYGTRPWREFGEGPNKEQKERYEVNSFTSKDIRFTQSKDAVYAIMMDWPEDLKVNIVSLAGERIKQVELLGHGKVEFNLTHQGLQVILPEKPPCSAAYALKVILQM